MEKFIEVYDDIIHPKLANQIEDLLLNNPPLNVKYTYITNITGSGDKVNKYLPGFQYEFLNPVHNFYEPTQYFLSQILYKLSNHLNFQIKQILKGRSFLQTPSITSQKNSIHIDLDLPHWVCLYYVTDSDGDTILFDDNNNETKRVTPKKGRIIFFDGSIKHCSSSPSKTHRSIINFDFIGEKL
tara:strand:+ start:21 stop:572 length:552 start_codon:yes stop_codon:yes gene_type:complete